MLTISGVLSLLSASGVKCSPCLAVLLGSVFKLAQSSKEWHLYMFYVSLHFSTNQKSLFVFWSWKYIVWKIMTTLYTEALQLYPEYNEGILLIDIFSSPVHPLEYNFGEDRLFEKFLTFPFPLSSHKESLSLKMKKNRWCFIMYLIIWYCSI